MLHTLALLVILPTSQLIAQQPDSLMEYLQEQDYPHAIAWQQAHMDSTNAKQVSMLAYTYYLAGNTQDAISNYNKVLQLDSNAVTAHQYLSNIYLQQDFTLKALPHLRRIATLRPNNAIAIRNLAFGLLSTQQVDEGLPLLSQAYQMNPNDPKTVNRVAEVRMDAQNYKGADSVLNAYLQKDSSQHFIISTAIRCSYYLKFYQHCIRLGDHLMRNEILMPGTMSYVAAACYTVSNYQHCIDIHQYLQDRQSPYEQIMYYAALSYTKMKKYEESNQLLNTCINLAKSKSLPDYYAAMGANDEGLFHFKPAIANMDTAYYLSGQAMHLYSIGRIYDADLKNQTAAKKYYKRYLQEGDSTDKQEAMIYKYLRETYFTK